MSELITDVLAKSITSERVGYYWETDKSFPTIEAFSTCTYEEARYKMGKLRDAVRLLGIKERVVSFDTEYITDNYSRILCVFDFKVTEVEVFKTVVGLLELQGRPYNHILADK